MVTALVVLGAISVLCGGGGGALLRRHRMLNTSDARKLGAPTGPAISSVVRLHRG